MWMGRVFNSRGGQLYIQHNAFISTKQSNLELKYKALTTIRFFTVSFRTSQISVFFQEFFSNFFLQKFKERKKFKIEFHSLRKKMMKENVKNNQNFFTSYGQYWKVHYCFTESLACTINVLRL